MEKEAGVCNWKLAKRLKELGVKQESLWWWMPMSSGIFEITSKENIEGFKSLKWFKEIEVYSAFTVVELGERLPNSYRTCRTALGKYLAYSSGDIYGAKDFQETLSDTEANARAKMLIYLLENKDRGGVMEAKRELEEVIKCRIKEIGAIVYGLGMTHENIKAGVEENRVTIELTQAILDAGFIRLEDVEIDKDRTLQEINSFFLQRERDYAKLFNKIPESPVWAIRDKLAHAIVEAKGILRVKEGKK